jgi:hypothetical protein
MGYQEKGYTSREIGSITGINRPRQGWAGKLNCFLLTTTAYITPLGFLEYTHNNNIIITKK